MNPFIRTLSISLLALGSTMAIACSDGGGGGGSSSGGQGGDDSSGSNGATGTSSASSGSTGSGTPAAMDWTGTWSVSLHYTVKCDTGFGNIKEATWDQIDTAQVDANGSGGLDATFPSNVNYGLSGTGNDKGLTLSGTYPAKDYGGKAAVTSQMDNSVTVKLDTVTDPDGALGTLSGTFKGAFGDPCEILDGTAGFSR